MEDVGIFNSYLVYLEAIWHILRLFWYILWLLGIFLRFGKLLQEKSGNPGTQPFMPITPSASFSRRSGRRWVKQTSHNRGRVF
jgi:hypothetical protein